MKRISIEYRKQSGDYFGFGLTTVWDWLNGLSKVNGLVLVLRHSIENCSKTFGDVLVAVSFVVCFSFLLSFPGSVQWFILQSRATVFLFEMGGNRVPRDHQNK